MRRSEIRDAMADEREHLVDDLAALTAADWDKPSLCEQWTVRDVVGHIIRVGDYYRFSAPFFAGWARSGFRVNAFLAQDAITRAAGESPDALLSALASSRYEKTIGGRIHPVLGMALGEWIIHGQDIRRPLGLVREFPIERLRVIADVVTARNGFPWGRKRLAFGRLEATDADYAYGEGAVTRLPMEAIVMTLAGRAVSVQ